MAETVAHEEISSRMKSAAANSIWLSFWPYVVLFMVIIVIVGISFWRVAFKREERLDYFFSIVSAIGLLFVLATLVIADVRTNLTAQKDEVTQIVEATQTNWLGLERQFMGDRDLLRLYKQMYSDLPPLQKLHDPPITQDVQRKEINMVQQLLGIVQNVNAIVSQQAKGWQAPFVQSWLAVFRDWFQSPLVREQWRQTQSLWTSMTNQFIQQYLLVPPR